MKFFPSKSQWSKWSLPGKAGYLGAWLGGIGLVIIIVNSFVGGERVIPVVSILSVDSLIHENSIKTKFSIKNAGKEPVFLVVKLEASIDSRTIKVIDQKFETQSVMLTPGQIIRFRGLTIEGNTYKALLNGTLIPEIRQTIRISYGNSEQEVDEHYVSQRVKLDVSKLANLKGGSQSPYGLWLLEEARGK